MTEKDSLENPTAPASLVGRLVRWLFSQTIKRVIVLDYLRTEIKNIEIAYSYLFMTNHGETGVRLAKEHSRLCDNFEKNKYWWMKEIKRIDI